MGWLTDQFGADDAMKAAEISQKGYQDAEEMYRVAGKDATKRFNPFYDMGKMGTKNIMSMYGPEGERDYTQFTNSPGYQFALEQGNRAVGNSGAARGMNMSGAQLKALNRFGQGTASQGFNNWFNQQMQMSGQGQNAANSMANVGMQTAGGMANMRTGGADARASGYLAKAGIKSGIANSILDAGLAAAGKSGGGGG